MIHRLVESDADGLSRRHLNLAIGRHCPYHSRHGRGEVPDVVLGQDAAGSVLQPGRHPRLVSRGRIEALLRAESIDGGVKPLALARHWRDEGQGLGQARLLGDGSEGHHGAVEHHRDQGIGSHLGGIGSRLDLGNLQVAYRTEVEAEGLPQNQAHGALGLLGHGHLVAHSSRKGRRRSESQGRVVGPVEAPRHDRLDRERPLRRGPIHRLVEDQEHRCRQAQLLAWGRRPLQHLR